MIRRAFTMRLKPDALDQYKYHHDHIWPELVAEIERAGIGTITTFQRGLELFLVSEICDEEAWDRLWSSPVHRRWAELMEPLMHLRDDGIVDASELTEVFHLSVGTSDNGAVTAIITEELSDEFGGDEIDTEVAMLEGGDSNGDWSGESAVVAAANQAALADALSELSEALDREYEMRGFSEPRQTEYATMEAGPGGGIHDPLADLIADTAASTDPSTLTPVTVAPIEQPPAPSAPAPHAPRRRNVSRKAGKKKPVVKKSAKGKKKSAAKPAKRGAKKSASKKKPGKKSAKKAVKKAAKRAKKASRKGAKRR
jgi:L-rhamnose mutarotase